MKCLPEQMVLKKYALSGKSIVWSILIDVSEWNWCVLQPCHLSWCHPPAKTPWSPMVGCSPQGHRGQPGRVKRYVCTERHYWKCRLCQWHRFQITFRLVNAPILIFFVVMLLLPFNATSSTSSYSKHLFCCRTGTGTVQLQTKSTETTLWKLS